MSYTYLFWLGIVVPTSITVVLFILFLVCWFKFNLREKFTKKKHDPHRVNQSSVRNPKPPTGLPPPPPVPNHRSRADERLPARVIYSTYHDSGMSELHEIHYKFDRPVSQASTDSEDSGFRSSKSAHYLPNRPSDHNIPQDIPLLKPVSANVMHAQRNPALNASDMNGGPSHGHSNNGPASASSGMSQLNGPLPFGFFIQQTTFVGIGVVQYRRRPTATAFTQRTSKPRWARTALPFASLLTAEPLDWDIGNATSTVVSVNTTALPPMADGPPWCFSTTERN